MWNPQFEWETVTDEDGYDRQELISSTEEVQAAWDSAPPLVRKICGADHVDGADGIDAEFLMITGRMGLPSGYWFFHLPDILQEIDKAGYKVIENELYSEREASTS